MVQAEEAAMLGIVLGIGCAALAYRLVHESKAVKLETITVPVADNLPPARTITVMHYSDLHFKARGGREQRVEKIALGLKPDLVVFTGDWLERPSKMADLKDFVKSLVNGAPAFGTWGNLERWRRVDLAELQAALAEAGVTILTNQWTEVMIEGLPVVVSGVDDPHYHFDDVRLATAGRPAASLNILLAHSPDLVPALATNQFDLVLCGHTHGGQIRLPVVGALSTATETKIYDKGLFTLGNTKLYVNRGIGTALLPLRFLCPPEVACLRVVGSSRRGADS